MKCPLCSVEPLEVAVEAAGRGKAIVTDEWELSALSWEEEVTKLTCLTCGLPLDIDMVEGWVEEEK